MGFNPLTIISGQGYISELIEQHSHFSDDWSSPSSQKMNGECSFFLKPHSALKVQFLVPQISTQNVTLNSDIEERCQKERIKRKVTEIEK